jgi:hypothetical protein
MASLSSLTAKFQSLASLSPLDKVNQTAAQVSGLAASAQGLATSFSSSLQQLGMSVDSIASSVTSQVDGIVGGGDPHYAMGGKATNRITETELTNARTATSPDIPSGQKYSVQVSPQGRITSQSTIASSETMDVYPPDVGRYYMQLDFGDYKRPSPFANTIMSTEYTVVLPIPNNLVESYDLNWTTLSLGLIGDVADAMTTGGGSTDPVQVGKSALGSIVGNISPEALVAIEQGIGATANPNVTAAFKGIQLRQHQFAWTFAPKTPEESRTIQKIIKNIRKRILPAMNSGSTSLLGYPSMVTPSIHPYVDGGKPLYDFKKCVVPKMSVAYSPTGIPSFFKGTNLPTFVQLSLNLLEIEYFTNITDDTVGDLGLAERLRDTFNAFEAPPQSNTGQ